MVMLMKHNIHFISRFINHKIYIILGYLFIVLEALTPILALNMQKELINQVFVNQIYELFPKLLALYAVFYFGPRLWFTIRKLIFFKLSYEVREKMTQSFLEKIYQLSARVFNEESSGKLLNHMRSDISEASDIAINQLLSETGKVLMSTFFLVITIGNVNVQLLILVVVLTFIYYYLIYRYGEDAQENVAKIRQAKSHLASQVVENISAIRETIAFDREGIQIHEFEKAYDNYEYTLKHEAYFQGKLQIISEPFLYGTKLVAIIVGGYMVMKGNSSLGTFVVTFTLVDQLVTALGDLFKQVMIGKRLTAIIEQIESVLDIESEQEGFITLKEPLSELSMHHVSFQYKEESKMILEDITVTFPKAKKIALVGESGCGKSTIGQLLLRAYKPDKGHICLGDVDIKDYNESYYNQVLMVFQTPYFLPLSIQENLCLEQHYESEYIEAICNKCQCHDFIMNLPNQYQTVLGERGVNLSGGQRQRLALARALLRNPEVLILDESTSALDTQTERMVQEAIDDMRREKTSIVIAHRLSTIQNADIIMLVDRGKIVDQGTHQELLERSKAYQRLYDYESLSP